MNLSEVSKKTLIDEFKYVALRLDKESEIPNKLYVYSAAHSVAYRVLNTEFDLELVLIHNVLRNTYTQINSAFGSMVAGAEKVIRIPEGLFSFLAQSLKGLADVLSEGGDVSIPLGKIAMAAYATTGNGYYLYEKGMLKWR